MEAARRQKLCRLVEKAENNKTFADRLGIKNKSTFQTKEKMERE